MAIRWNRTLSVAAVFAWALVALITVQKLVTMPEPLLHLGTDYDLYMRAARAWLDGDGFYLAHQLRGAYASHPGDVLYPPIVLWLLVPFTVLPPVLWWVIPLGLTALAIVKIGPSPLGWLLVALLVGLPQVREPVFWGNPVMWSVMGLAWGFLVAWPSTLVLLKPSLFPFAFVGANRRSWWVALTIFGVAAIPFGGLWIDYAHVILDSGIPLDYSLVQVPLMLVPFAAVVGRRRSQPRSADEAPRTVSVTHQIGTMGD